MSVSVYFVNYWVDKCSDNLLLCFNSGLTKPSQRHVSGKLYYCYIMNKSIVSPTVPFYFAQNLCGCSNMELQRLNAEKQQLETMYICAQSQLFKDLCEKVSCSFL